MHGIIFISKFNEELESARTETEDPDAEDIVFTSQVDYVGYLYIQPKLITLFDSGCYECMRFPGIISSVVQC